MDNVKEVIITICSLIVGVAILSVLVSRKSNTTGVIQASASGFGNMLNVAMSPVTGATFKDATLAYPDSNNQLFPTLF